MLIPTALVQQAAEYSAYTPTWTTTGDSPSLGDGTLVGRYARVGDIVVGRIRLDIGSTTNTGTGAWRFSLPVSGTTGPSPLGTGEAFDADTGIVYPCYVRWISTTTVSVSGLNLTGGTNVKLDELTGTAFATWVATDVIHLAFVYEAA